MPSDIGLNFSPLGLVVPIAAIGVISELTLPLALLPDAAFVLFLRML